MKYLCQTVLKGADGPTAVFIAGKVNHLYLILAVLAAAIICAAAALIWKKRKK